MIDSFFVHSSRSVRFSSFQHSTTTASSSLSFEAFLIIFFFLSSFLVVNWSMIESFHLLNLLLVFIGFLRSLLFCGERGVFKTSKARKNRMKLLLKSVYRFEK